MPTTNRANKLLSVILRQYGTKENKNHTFHDELMILTLRKITSMYNKVPIDEGIFYVTWYSP